MERISLTAAIPITRSDERKHNSYIQKNTIVGNEDLNETVKMKLQSDIKTRTFVITVWPPFDLTKSCNLLAEAFSSELPPSNNDEIFLREARPDCLCPYL